MSPGDMGYSDGCLTAEPQLWALGSDAYLPTIKREIK